MSDREITFIIPIRAASSHVSPEFRLYIEWLRSRAQVVVVDGSRQDVFAEHAAAWGKDVVHVAPHPELVTPMGKVGGVLTGVRLAAHDKIIVADDDVRYDAVSFEQVAAALDTFDVVRPQNYFAPLPWHARWDTGRMLLNRVMEGDWPGTLGVRRSTLLMAGGYDGSVMFENLELVRTIVASGGSEGVLRGTYVRRLPSTSRHFWSQRVRQAYDEFARPGRLIVQLAILPCLATLVRHRAWGAIAASAIGVCLVAEAGRRRDGGTRVFPPTTSLFAPVWLAERAICSWLAVASRIAFGGVRYAGNTLRNAATPEHILRSRIDSRRVKHLEVDRLESPIVRHLT